MRDVMLPHLGIYRLAVSGPPRENPGHRPNNRYVQVDVFCCFLFFSCRVLRFAATSLAMNTGLRFGVHRGKTPGTVPRTGISPVTAVFLSLPFIPRHLVRCMLWFGRAA